MPAALGAPANISVLTTYIFKLTAWSPPLYNTAAAVAILLMMVTAIFGLGPAARPVGPQLRHGGRQGVPAAQPQSRAVALVHLQPGPRLPVHRRRAADHRARSSRPSASSCSSRTSTPLFDMKAYSWVHFNAMFDNPLTMLSIWNTMKVGVITAVVGGVAGLRHRLHDQPHPGPRPQGRSTSCRPSRSPSPAWSSASPICGPGSACRAASTARSGSWRWPSSRASCPTR